jgi:hypothetical protein
MSPALSGRNVHILKCTALNNYNDDLNDINIEKHNCEEMYQSIIMQILALLRIFIKYRLFLENRKLNTSRTITVRCFCFSMLCRKQKKTLIHKDDRFSSNEPRTVLWGFPTFWGVTNV